MPEPQQDVRTKMLAMAMGDQYIVDVRGQD
ncbi:hypothetical protein XaFJ1_GM001047 [Xanthomonas albilineans]|nr:hypothetical protein XaFJ1_GM001047 [Xanthomonas albilineans]